MHSAFILSVLAIAGVSATSFERRQITDLCDRRYAVCLSAGQTEKYCSCERTICKTGDKSCENPTTSSPSGPIITASPNSLPLGALCSSTNQCWNGAECFSSNVLRPARCGGFNAACTSDTQCDGVICNSGLCNGAPKPPANPNQPPTPPINVPINSLNLGEQCDNDKQCKAGAQCFASNVMAVRRCGGFNAACTSNAQCAFNTCSNGLCSGQPLTSTTPPAKPPTSSTSSSSSLVTAPPTPSPQPPIGGSGSQPPSPPVKAPNGSLKLGEQCSEDKQCQGGAQCWASNVMLIKRCGNFNAACTSNAQCANNTCNRGLCNGVLPTGSAPAPGAPTGTGPTPPSGTGSGSPSRGNGTAPGVSSRPNPPVFTGDADRFNAALGMLGAVALAAVAL